MMYVPDVWQKSSTDTYFILLFSTKIEKNCFVHQLNIQIQFLHITKIKSICFKLFEKCLGKQRTWKFSRFCLFC